MTTPDFGQDELETLRLTASSAQIQASKAKEALRAVSESVPPETHLAAAKPTIKARTGAVTKPGAASDVRRKVSTTFITPGNVVS